HVAGKEELLRLAVTRALDGLFAVLDEPGATEGRAVDRFAYVIRRTCLELVRNLPYVTLLLRVRGNTEVERAALARRRAFDALVAQLVADAERDGDIRADIDQKLTARLLFGMVNSIVEWYRPAASEPPATDRNPLADAVCAIAFDGLRVRR
ncbi:MAG TPA: TetR family transcriptional regulator, partial [Trebonia sp.]|nr:TetR family transcriptional regulator [Trebonia sp.]